MYEHTIAESSLKIHIPFVGNTEHVLRFVDVTTHGSFNLKECLPIFDIVCFLALWFAVLV